MMNCPYCGKEMVSGFVQCSRAFFFATQEHSFLYKPSAAKGEFYLSSHNFTNPRCAAHHCPACKKVLIDYAEESE